MIKDVRDRYFDYLISVSESSWTKHELFPLQILFKTEFYDLVPHDENRIADAKLLREDFLKSSQNLPQEIDIIRDMGPTNCLEVMVALAERMDFLTCNGDGINRTGCWFWEMFHNLDLSVDTNKDNIELYKAKIQRFVDRNWLKLSLVSTHQKKLLIRSKQSLKKSVKHLYRLKKVLDS